MCVIIGLNRGRQFTYIRNTFKWIKLALKHNEKAANIKFTYCHV